MLPNPSLRALLINSVCIGALSRDTQMRRGNISLFLPPTLTLGTRERSRGLI